MTGLLRAATIAAAVAAAVSGGALFAFSSFVMPALRRLPDPVGMRAMQAINAAAPTPSFMIVLFGAGALAVGVAVVGSTRGLAPLVIPAAALYVATLAITAGYHVPRNDALMLLDPGTAEGLAAWRAYVTGWSRMNHMRAATAIAAGALLVAASR